MSLIEHLFEDEFKSMGFFARNEEVPHEWKTLREGMYNNMIRKDDTSVKIMRPMFFFAEEQKGVTLAKLREFYTEKAIALYEQYGYFKFD